MSLVRKAFNEEQPTINVHVFCSVLRLWFTEAVPSRQNAINDLNTMFSRNAGEPYVMNQREEDQVDEYRTHYDGLPNAAARRDYLHQFESSHILAAPGAGIYIAKEIFRSLNGLSDDALFEE